MIKEPTHTVVLPLNDGLVEEMLYYFVISPAGSTHAVNMINPQIPFFLQPWVIERIDSDPELKDKFGR